MYKRQGYGVPGRTRSSHDEEEASRDTAERATFLPETRTLPPGQRPTTRPHNDRLAEHDKEEDAATTLSVKVKCQRAGCSWEEEVRPGFEYIWIKCFMDADHEKSHGIGPPAHVPPAAAEQETFETATVEEAEDLKQTGLLVEDGGCRAGKRAPEMVTLPWLMRKLHQYSAGDHLTRCIDQFTARARPEAVSYTHLTLPTKA